MHLVIDYKYMGYTTELETLGKGGQYLAEA